MDYIDIYAIIEFIPIFLALIVLIYTYTETKREKWNTLTTFIAVNAFILIFVQLSWAATVSMGFTLGTVFANYTWTVFNSLVMISYILFIAKAKNDRRIF